MAWSNQENIKAISTLPDQIYGLRAAEGEWPIGKLLNHFLIGSGEWYRYILTGAKWTDVEKVTSSEILLKYAPYVAELDAGLIAQSKLDDEVIEFEGENGIGRTSRSLVLSQAVMHAAEHKGQVATVLKANGFFLDLDKYDHWSFEEFRTK